MPAEQKSGIGAAGRAALDALYAENRACAARLRACYSLHQLCVDEQTARDIEAGYYDADLYPDDPAPPTRPCHAEVDPLDIACAELVARYGIHHNRAKAILELANNLVERFPAMVAEMEAGWLDERTASMLALHMRTVDSSVRHAAQRAVLDWLRDAIASGNRPGRDAILAKTDRIIHDLDPAGVLARRESALRERNVRVRRRPDGMADLTAHLSAAEASTISSVLDSSAKEAIARDKAARIDAVQKGATPDEARENGAGPFLGERSHGERRADALVDALLGARTNQYATSTPTRGGIARDDSGGAGAGDDRPEPQIRPVVTVLAPLGPDEEPEAYFPRSGPASIDALFALLSRSVGSTISLINPTPGAGDTAEGVGRYRISAELARRVRLRDGTCRHPGCSEPAENCDLDHVQPFNHSDPARGGPTAEANLMCLCRRHHRFKTFHRWRYRLEPDGTLTITTTSDHTISTSPHGPMALWRERTKPDRPGPTPEPPAPDIEAVSRPWLRPGPRSTEWYRRACRLSAERRRNIEVMRDELAEQLQQAYQSQDPAQLDQSGQHGPPGSSTVPRGHAGTDSTDLAHEVDLDPPPF